MTYIHTLVPRTASANNAANAFASIISVPPHRSRDRPATRSV
jgi:hypothetical protein